MAPVARGGSLMLKTAQHRPATRRRTYRHDEYTCVDLFSGFGGLTLGVILAGFTAITAANHNAYKVEVHEANHPTVEHWIADLANPESSDYHSAADLPAADLLVAGVTCTNHTIANTQRAYLQGLSLFDVDDPDWEERATRSERDRATATCVLQYAGKHRPKMILIECTTELQSWGYALPGKRKVGDGSTFRWWLNEHVKLGYKYKILYLNSMFFGVPQSRDRLYICFWLESLPTPDLEHRPPAWCGKCQTGVEAVWTWKTGVPPTGQVRWGVQYVYRCPSCRREVVPRFAPSLHALDLSNLGTRIGDRKKDLAPATMARAERCRKRFADFPAVLMPITRRGESASTGSHPGQPMRTQTAQQETALLSAMVMPAKADRGAERGVSEPLGTQTGQQEAALLTTGAIMQIANSYEHPGSECRTRDLAEPLWTQPATNSTGLLTPGVALAVDNFQGSPRGAGEPLPTQGGSETMAIVSAGVLPYRKNTTPTTHAEAMPTVTAEQIPGLITALGLIQQNEGVDRRVFPASDPLRTVVGNGNHFGLLAAGWYKSNGSTGNETAPHPVLDPFNTITAHDTTTLLTHEWRQALADLTLEDCYFRMLAAHEIGRGCGFDVDWPNHKGSFIVWGSARNQVDGFGNAVSPQVGEWIGLRLRAALHGEQVAA